MYETVQYAIVSEESRDEGAMNPAVLMTNRAKAVSTEAVRVKRQWTRTIGDGRDVNSMYGLCKLQPCQKHLRVVRITILYDRSPCTFLPVLSNLLGCRYISMTYKSRERRSCPSSGSNIPLLLVQSFELLYVHLNLCRGCQ